MANGGSFSSRNATAGRAEWLPQTVSTALAGSLLSVTRLQASVAQDRAGTWKPALGSVLCRNQRSPRALRFKIKCGHWAGPHPRLHKATVSYWAPCTFSGTRCVFRYINKRWAVGRFWVSLCFTDCSPFLTRVYSTAWCPPLPNLP